jgi:hypothetical protein
MGTGSTTLLVGLRHDGIIAPLVIDGAINGEVFLAYVEQMLAATPSHLATSRDVYSTFKHDLSRYAISSISDLAAPRSDVAKPSVNRL